MRKMTLFAVAIAARISIAACSILLLEAVVKRRTMASIESLVRQVAKSNRSMCIRLYNTM